MVSVPQSEQYLVRHEACYRLVISSAWCSLCFQEKAAGNGVQSQGLLYIAVPMLPLVLHTFGLHYSLSSSTISFAGQLIHRQQEELSYMTFDVPLPSIEVMVFHNSVNRTIPRAGVAAEHQDDPERLWTTYLRMKMTTFSQFPQGWMICRMCNGSKDRAIFDEGHLAHLGLEDGERLCVIYVVHRRMDGKADVELVAPTYWNGPIISGTPSVRLLYR